MFTFRPIAAAVAAVLAVAFGAGAAGSATVSGRSLCTMISARQLASVHVSGGGCVQKGPTPFAQYATVRKAVWGTIQGSHAVLTVYDVKAAYVGAARSVFQKDGTSVGIGDWSSFRGHANGKTFWEIVFGKGSKVVDLTVTTPPGKPLASGKPFLALAKSVAARV